MIHFLDNNKSFPFIQNNHSFDNLKIDTHSSNDVLSKECETLRDLLQLSEIIDKEGAILKPEKLSDLIKLDEPQEKLLDLLLDCPINFPFEKESASFPLRKLLEHLYNRHEKEIQSITIKGGFTRRFLLSKPFLSVMLEEIGLDKEKIDLLLKEELLQSVEGPLADIDISFQLREGARPEELTQAVRESVQSGLLKFCLISDESSNFSIASFEKLDISSLCNFSANFPKSSSDSKKEYTNIEILAVRKSRDYLFPIDALAIDITGAIQGKKEKSYFLKSFYQKGHQTILDLIHRIIRIKDPKTINETGFPALLSYLSKGFTAIGDKDTLLQTFLKSKNSKQKFFDYFKSHHENKPDFWIAMLFHLRQSPNTALIFQWIKNEINHEERKFSKTYLELYKFLSGKNFSVDSLNALLTLSALFAKFNGSSTVSLKTEEEKQIVQFKPLKEGPTLLLPFLPIESFQMFIDLCKKGQKEIIDITHGFFEQILFTTGHAKNKNSLMFDGSLRLTQMLKEQLKTSQGPLFYFSYLLFLSIPSMPQERELLFQCLPEAIRDVPPTWKKKLVECLSFLYPESPYKEFLMQLDEKMLENPETLLKNWISLLFKSSDQQLLREILLRKKFENDLPLDIAASFLKKTSCMLSKEQEERILLRLFSIIPSLTSKEPLRELFSLTIEFLQRVKKFKRKCSKEFEKAYAELIKTAFKKQEIDWGNVLLKQASLSKLGPLSKKNRNNTSPLIEFSEPLFENEENQKVIDPILLILAPQRAEKQEENNKITYWIQKRIQSFTAENRLSKLGLRLLSSASERFSKKDRHEYTLSFYEKACDTEDNQIAFNLLKTLLKSGFCMFEMESFAKKTERLLKELAVTNKKEFLEFIDSQISQNADFTASFFSSFSSLLTQQEKVGCMMQIFESLSEKKAIEEKKDHFLLLLASENPNEENQKNKITTCLKERFETLVEDKKFSENDVKILNAIKKDLSEEDAYQYTLRLYKKAVECSEKAVSLNLLSDLLQSRFFSIENPLFIKTSDLLESLLLSSKFCNNEQESKYGLAIIFLIDKHFSQSNLKKAYGLLGKFLEKGPLKEPLELKLSEVLTARVATIPDFVQEEMEMLINVGLSDELFYRLSGLMAPEVIMGRISIKKIESKKQFCLLMNVLKEQLALCSFKSFQLCDSGVVSWLMLKEKALCEYPAKRFRFLSDLFFQSLKSSSIQKKQQCCEPFFHAINDLLSNEESVKFLEEESLVHFLNQLLELKTESSLEMVLKFLEQVNGKNFLSPKVLSKLWGLYFVSYANLQYRKQWEKAAEYLLEKYEWIKLNPQEWIDALIDHISSYVNNPELKSHLEGYQIVFNKINSLDDISDQYNRFLQLQEKFLTAVRLLDREHLDKYRYLFLGQVLQKFCETDAYFSRLYLWIAEEVDSLVSSEVLIEHYDVLEKYFFWSGGYLTSLYKGHFLAIHKIVTDLKKKGFYDDQPEKLAKIYLYFGVNDQKGETLLEFIKSILANRSKKALNWALEMLIVYQSEIKGENQLIILKECYQKIFELAKSYPDSKMVINGLDKSNSSMICAIWFVLQSGGPLLLHQEFSKNLIPYTDKVILNAPITLINSVINGIQHLKDKGLMKIGNFCKIECFPPKKHALEFIQEFSDQFFSLFFQNEKIVIKQFEGRVTRLLRWTANCAIILRNHSAFIGKDGHKKYYIIAENLLRITFHCPHEDSRREKMLAELYDLITGCEDKKTNLYVFSKDQSLCMAFSEEIIEKRKKLLDQLFQGFLEYKLWPYETLVNKLYRRAQEAGFYGKDRQKQPKLFVSVISPSEKLEKKLRKKMTTKLFWGKNNVSKTDLKKTNSLFSDF